MGKLTVYDIRAQYPHPRIAGEWSSEPVTQYCVGGACLLAHGLGADRFVADRYFPSRGELASYLMQVNLTITRRSAEYYAARIISKNDAGQFDQAWTFLDRALSRKGESHE